MCKVEKNVEEFSSDTRSNDGYYYRCRVCNSEYRKAKKYSNSALKWQQNNKERWNAYLNQYSKDHRIAHSHRTYLSKLINGSRSGKKYFKEVMGIESREKFIEYLNSTAPAGYSVADWGMGKRLEIDHIKPLISFDLTKAEERKKAFHYTNIRLIFREDNKIKGYKLVA